MRPSRFGASHQRPAAAIDTVGMERMSDFEAERERIRQSPPPELVAEAAANPGGLVASIDSDYIGDPDGFIPGEAIQGVWLVDADGKLTGEFKENPNYGPPKDGVRQAHRA
jgi:hypothetical protein